MPKSCPPLDPQIPPPGFQLLFEANKSDLDSTFNQIILPIHWSVIRTPSPHNYRLINGPEILSESLPDDWQTGSVKKDESAEAHRYIELFYKDGNEVIRVKVSEIGDGNVALHVKGYGDNEGGGGVVRATDYLVGEGGGPSSVAGVYKVAELWELERLVQEIVMGRVEGPYASKLPAKKKTQEPAPSTLQEPTRGALPLDPFHDLGRSDLDPFHGPGAGGGMLMDPRGFRRPQLPQGIIPGSRFDPVGPLPGGLLGPRRGRGGLGGVAPPLPFGCPDPDHERGYDDMFM